MLAEYLALGDYQRAHNRLMAIGHAEAAVPLFKRLDHVEEAFDFLIDYGELKKLKEGRRSFEKADCLNLVCPATGIRARGTIGLLIAETAIENDLLPLRDTRASANMEPLRANQEGLRHLGQGEVLLSGEDGGQEHGARSLHEPVRSPA